MKWSVSIARPAHQHPWKTTNIQRLRARNHTAPRVRNPLTVTLSLACGSNLREARACVASRRSLKLVVNSIANRPACVKGPTKRSALRTMRVLTSTTQSTQGVHARPHAPPVDKHIIIQTMHSPTRDTPPDSREARTAHCRCCCCCSRTSGISPELTSVSRPPRPRSTTSAGT